MRGSTAGRPGLLATRPVVRGGRLLGPSRFRETQGPVTEASVSSEVGGHAVGRRLWPVATELTGVGCLDQRRG